MSFFFIHIIKLYEYNLLGDNMDKTDIISNYNHNITINERKNIVISGVKKIESFDEEEFLLETAIFVVSYVNVIYKLS